MVRRSTVNGSMRDYRQVVRELKDGWQSRSNTAKLVGFSCLHQAAKRLRERDGAIFSIKFLNFSVSRFETSPVFHPQDL